MCDTIANCSTTSARENEATETNNSGDNSQPSSGEQSREHQDFADAQQSSGSNDYFIMTKLCSQHQKNHNAVNSCINNVRRTDNCANRFNTIDSAQESNMLNRACEHSGLATAAFYETDSIASGCSINSRRSGPDGCYHDSMRNYASTASCNWQLFTVSLWRSNPEGFGIAVIGGRDNPQCLNDNSIIVSDVIPSGPAFGLLQVNDRIISANGVSFECVDYATAISVMKDAEKLNMIVKRRIPLPFVEYEQRTLKFTLSKSHKKDDFGIVLGCRYYIKEITNPKLAEKDPGLKEGDTVLRVNGQSLESLSLEEATRLLHRSREKLSLVVQRDVRRAPGGGSRWPSQTTVYERLGSVSATPRQSPTPVHYTHSANHTDGMSISASPHLRKISDLSPGPKRFSDSAAPSVTHMGHPSPLPQYNQKMALASNSQQLGFEQVNGQSANSGSQYQQNARKCSPHHLSDRPSQSLPKNYQDNIYRPSQLQSGNQINSTQQFKGQGNLQPSAQLTSQTPTSSIMSTSSIMEQSSPHPSLQCHVHQDRNGQSGYGSAHYNIHSNAYSPSPLHGSQHSCSSSIQHQSQLHAANHFNPPTRSDLSVLNFYKGNGSLGIRVIGGNQVGIFVSVVQENSPAAKNGIKVGDRIHTVNDFNMNGVTREEAVEFLLSLGDSVTMHIEHLFADDFSNVKGEQMGDNFYIRTHFQYQKRSSRQELNFNEGDIFHVTDTLAGGSPGYWQVTKVYSANETDIKSSEASGIIPHAKVAETLAKQSRVDSTTIGRSIFRRKLQTSRTKSLTNTMEEDSIQVPAYERVSLKKPAFHRPIVLYGPLADVARELLLERYPHQFGAVSASAAADDANSPLKSATDGGDTSPQSPVLYMSSIDAIMAAQRHCVLSISPVSVERLQLAQYAPIVILIDVDSRTRVRELRSKSGAGTTSARRLMEHATKIKRQHSHLLTATLDASKEDGWFEALRHLIFHLQERRVWMPETQLPRKAFDDALLFPLQISMTEAQDNSDLTKYRSYGQLQNDCNIYDATSSSVNKVNSSVQSANDELSRLRGGFDLSYPANANDANGLTPSYQPYNGNLQRPPVYGGACAPPDLPSTEYNDGSLRRPANASGNSVYATSNRMANSLANEPLTRRNIGYMNTTIPANSSTDYPTEEKVGASNPYATNESIENDPILKHYLPGMITSQLEVKSINVERKQMSIENANKNMTTVNANFNLRRVAQSPKPLPKNGAS